MHALADHSSYHNNDVFALKLHSDMLCMQTNGSKRGDALPNTPDSSKSVETPQSALQPLYGDPDEEVFNKWNFSPF